MPYKLNDRKIRWMIREIEKGDLTRNRMAWTQRTRRRKRAQRKFLASSKK